MERGGFIVILALMLIAMLFVGGSRITEGFDHRSTAIKARGVKLTRASLAQMSGQRRGATGSTKSLYSKVPPCLPRLARRGTQPARKLCDCGGDGVRSALEFPNTMCSPHDRVIL